MFEIKVRDYLFIAHSLKDDFFGEAKNLHGATYVADLIISSAKLNEKNIVMDIGLASRLLKKCISKYNYKNLDEIKEFDNSITTTEFMAMTLVNDYISELNKENFDFNHIKSVKIILNESHIASASYYKKF
ncbi:MAG: 6-carboxytetrahydropterin synthase [Pseudomonadota bacterium]|nr:6-carboxytetrahydropterin synthase [Pseudomonadota bacterium]